MENGLLADSGASICAIPCAEAFAGLSEAETLYVHHMCRASFQGTRIVLRQTSAESESIYDLICELSRVANGDWLGLAAQMDVGRQDIEFFLEYAAMFLGNLGNYRSTEDQKFIPRVDANVLGQLCQVSSSTKELFDIATEGIGYYPGPGTISEKDITAVQNYLQSNGILPENTRVAKAPSDSGVPCFVLHTASSDPGAFQKPDIKHEMDGASVSFEPGDHSDQLVRVVQELSLAVAHAATEEQKSMINALIECFRTGNHQHFKTAQTFCVRDHSPNVETVMGFIETYQDPHGVRGAWEGIVAVVNQQQSHKFSTLVDRSSEFIAKLPWNGKGAGLEDGELSCFESTNFVKPGFTSLDTIGFLKSESPAGLNLPNFEDICQNVGSKNLAFGNVNLANPLDEVIPFILPEELQFLRDNRENAFEVLVACHELFGHGSGRLLVEHSPGEYNFSITSPPLNPITGLPVQSWYKPGETWSSVFGADANAIEECRADGVSLILITDEEILRIFGYSNSSKILADDIMYAGFLTFLYGTINGLSRWDPETKKWGQSQARGKFALLKCLLGSSPELLHIKETADDLKIVLDRTKIRSHAVPALSKFLLQLQVYKSTADSQQGIPFFDNHSRVDEKFAGYRRIVTQKSVPRIQYVQPNTVLENGVVQLREYPATKEGLIQSWVERDV
ncbi:hypothetical protein V2A60_000040 [Cordyceps javanica]